MLEWIGLIFGVLFCFLKANGFNPSYMLGGFAGGIVRAIATKTGRRTDRLIGGFMGAILAAYLTPIVIGFTGATIPVSSVSFLIGLVGMSLVDAVISLGRDYQKHPGKFKDDLRELILRIIGPKKGDE